MIFYRFLLASFTTNLPPPTNFAITWSIYKVNFNCFSSCSVLYRTFPELLVSTKTIWVESRDRTGIHVITHATVSSVKSHQEFFPQTNSVSVVRYALSVVYGRYNRARHPVSGRFVRECRRYIKNTPPWAVKRAIRYHYARFNYSESDENTRTRTIRPRDGRNGLRCRRD